MLKLAFRNLFRQRTRTALTLAVIVLGVVGLVLSGGFVEDIYIQLREFTIHSRLGHLQVYKTGYYLHGRRNPYQYMIDEPDVVVADLARLPHVGDVMRRVNFSGLLNTGRADLAVIGEGVEPAKETRLGSFFSVIDGRQLGDEDVYGILLGEGVAKSLQLAPGDFANLLLNTTAGDLNSLELEVIGVFRTFSQDYDARAVRIQLETAQELLDTSAVHALVLSLDRTKSTQRVAQWIRDRLPSARFEVKTWHDLADFYRKTVDLYKRQFGVLQLIILGMVLLSVANSVNMAAHERVGEFGTLRALGQRSRDIRRLMLFENVILGFLGASLGVTAGVGLAWFISRVGIPMPAPPNANTGYTAYVRIVPFVIGVAFMVGVVATVLSSLLPAAKVSRVPIAAALRENI